MTSATRFSALARLALNAAIAQQATVNKRIKYRMHPPPDARKNNRQRHIARSRGCGQARGLQSARRLHICAVGPLHLQVRTPLVQCARLPPCANNGPFAPARTIMSPRLLRRTGIGIGEKLLLAVDLKRFDGVLPLE